MTRQQRYLTQALMHVEAVSRKPKEVRDIYGGLCHQTPVLVRTCGLCQTLAFIAEKAKTEGFGERATAYQLLNQHIADVLGVAEGELLNTIRKAPMLDYMRYTRAVLAAGIYYKRFAGSILKIASAQSLTDAEVSP